MTVRLIAIGLIVIVITDSIYDYQTLQGIYANGLQDVGWPLGYMLIGLAAQALNMLHKRQHLTLAARTAEASSQQATVCHLVRMVFLPELCAYSGGHTAGDF